MPDRHLSILRKARAQRGSGSCGLEFSAIKAQVAFKTTQEEEHLGENGLVTVSLF